MFKVETFKKNRVLSVLSIKHICLYMYWSYFWHIPCILHFIKWLSSLLEMRGIAPFLLLPNICFKSFYTCFGKYMDWSLWLIAYLFHFIEVNDLSLITMSNQVNNWNSSVCFIFILFYKINFGATSNQDFVLLTWIICYPLIFNIVGFLIAVDFH